MVDKSENSNDIGILIHAATMMIFSGLILAVTIEMIYAVILWIGAVVCIGVGIKRYKNSLKKKEINDIEN